MEFLNFISPVFITFIKPKLLKKDEIVNNFNKIGENYAGFTGVLDNIFPIFTKIK